MVSSGCVASKNAGANRQGKATSATPCPIRPIYFTLLAVHVAMAFVVAVLVPVTFYNALRQRFAIHKRFARITLPLWLFVAVSGLVVYVMAVHLYPAAGS